MEDALRPPVLQRPPPSPSPDAPAHRSTISPFYYSLMGIASIALILLAYNIVVVGWCWQHHRARRRLEGYSSRSASNPPPKSVEGIPLYKYRKEETPTPVQASPECPVCLSAFADGEDIRQLPKCKHLFHADCIDMWLYSHSNCPICRADVVVPPALRCRNPAPADWERRSAEAVMAFGNVV